MSGLQPLLIFKSEITRVNELYWSSTYAYSHILSFVKKNNGNHAPNPLVEDFWGASDYALDRIAIVNPEALRVISILYLCSAFENALSGYCCLCSLYEERKGNAKYKGDDVPLLLKEPDKFKSRRKSVLNFLKSDSFPLKGSCTGRLEVFHSTWGVAKFSGASLSKLNGYYNARHKIAHDQGLGSPDNPEFSAEEILASRVALDESKWKQMMNGFQEVLNFLDKQIAISVVKDRGLALAVYRILHRDGPILTGDLMKKLKIEWRIGQFKRDHLHKLILNLDGKVKQVNGNKYQVSL